MFERLGRRVQVLVGVLVLLFKTRTIDGLRGGTATEGTEFVGGHYRQIMAWD